MKNTIPVPAFRVSGTGAPVLCFHSSGSSSGQWAALMERLHGRYRLLATDLAGYGGSLPWESGEVPSLQAEVARVEGLLHMLQEPAHVVGHSYGGAVALRFAMNHPDRVASLVLFEPMPFALLQHVRSGAAALAEIREVADRIIHAMAEGQVDVAAGVFFDYWSGQGFWDRLAPDTQARFSTRMPAITSNFDALFADPARPQDLWRLDVPVLFLGSAEPLPPAAAIHAVLATYLPHMETRKLGGIGHMGPVTHADRVNPEIDRFISAHSRSAAMVSLTEERELPVVA